MMEVVTPTSTPTSCTSNPNLEEMMEVVLDIRRLVLAIVVNVLKAQSCAATSYTMYHGLARL
jgi:hypothetical protein